MKKNKIIILIFLAIFATLIMSTNPVFCNDELSERPIFDDKLLLDGYAEKYEEESKETILAMIKDDSLNPFKMAAAIRVFREQYSSEVFSREKKIILKHIIRRLNRTTSPFVETEAMYTICTMNRYKYFKSMVPALIYKLDHYNQAVNEIAYKILDDIIKTSTNKPREARIIFTTLRKILFLSRKRLASVTEPDSRLKQKLSLTRWSIKILGSQELRRLPKEVINLL